jgi:DnaJ-class molecular chaperone
MPAIQPLYYDLLGVSRTASDAELKQAYRKLAREMHPDTGASKEDEEQFKDITTAYKVLSRPDRRRQYDEEQAHKAAADADSVEWTAPPIAFCGRDHCDLDSLAGHMASEWDEAVKTTAWPGTY